MRQHVGRLHKARDLYEASGTTIPYSLYLKVLKLYFSGIVKLLLAGYIWDLGSYLSTISVQQVKRKYKKPRVDWGATRKLKASGAIGLTDLVYYTDQPYWYHFAWNKYSAKILNKTAYRFSITTGPLGNSRKLSNLLQTNPLAHLNFVSRGISNRKLS